jgi:hypothetical protein
MVALDSLAQGGKPRRQAGARESRADGMGRRGAIEQRVCDAVRIHPLSIP